MQMPIKNTLFKAGAKPAPVANLSHKLFILNVNSFLYFQNSVVG